MIINTSGCQSGRSCAVVSANAAQPSGRAALVMGRSLATNYFVAMISAFEDWALIRPWC